MVEQLKKTAGYAGIYALGSLLNRGVSIIMLPIYTRALTPADYGVLEVLMATVEVISIFTGLGLLNSLHKYFYKYDDERDRRQVVSTLFGMILALYGFSCSLGILVAPTISRLAWGSADNAFFVRMTLINLFLSFLVFIPLGYLQARQLPKLFVILSATKLVCQLSLNILFVVHLEMGVVGVLYSTCIALIVTGGFATAYMLRENGFEFSRSKAGELARFSYPFVFTGLAAFITTSSDRFFLQRFHDETTVGLYGLAYKFGFFLMFFPVSPIFRVWNVQRFELAKQGNYAPIFNRFFVWFCVVVGAAGLGITLFVRDVVRVMADYAFRDAWVVVPILILAYFLQACTDFFNFGIYHAGKSKHMAFGTGLAAIVILGLSFWWIPIYGAAGAAWATLVAFAVRLGYVYVASQRVCPIDYRLGRPLLIVSLAVGLFLVWRGVVASGVDPERLHLTLPASALLWLAFPLVLLLGPILAADDRRLLLRLIRHPRQTLAEIRG